MPSPKVGLVLRAIGIIVAAGSTTSMVARSTLLPRPTAHRLLSDLAEHGFVAQPDTGR
ncbi:helix-turn-helix domain-containing protein [Pseudonocardia sp. GCM10023141]|uniref:helix-turn-helix domain-containing protein n=1 Tax=Pseudonocardia sp. GCM10023141 TaxID=3252653 RepID=UPI003607389D